MKDIYDDSDLRAAVLKSLAERPGDWEAKKSTLKLGEVYLQHRTLNLAVQPNGAITLFQPNGGGLAVLPSDEVKAAVANHPGVLVLGGGNAESRAIQEAIAVLGGPGGGK